MVTDAYTRCKAITRNFVSYKVRVMFGSGLVQAFVIDSPGYSAVYLTCILYFDLRNKKLWSQKAQFSGQIICSAKLCQYLGNKFYHKYEGAADPSGRAV